MDEELIRKATESHFFASWQTIEDSDSYEDFIDGVRLFMCTNEKGQEALDEILSALEEMK